MRKSNYYNGMMKRISKGLLCVAGAMMLLVGQLQAQSSNLIYGANSLPHAVAMNPALFPDAKVYVTLPGVQLGLTSPVAYSDIFQYDQTNQQTNIDLNKIIDQLRLGNTLSLNMNVPALGFGFRVKNWFVTFTSQMLLDVQAGIPMGVIDLVTEGNQGYVGSDNTMTLIDDGLANLNLYTEMGLGVGYRLHLLFGDLSMSGRLKRLIGYGNLNMDNTYARLYTAEDLSTMRADLYYQVNLSSIADLSGDKPVVTTFVPNNTGWGVDLGVRFENRLFDASIGILDIGSRIHWNENVCIAVPKDGSGAFVFEGIDVGYLAQEGSIDTTMTAAWTDTLNSLKDYEIVEGERYWTSLPLKVSASAFVKPLRWLRAGLVYRGEVASGRSSFNQESETLTHTYRSVTTAMLNLNLNNWFELSLGNSFVQNGSTLNVFNPSIGCTMAPFTLVQMYFMMDYFSSLYLVDTKSFSASMGMSFLIGRRTPKRR